MVGVWSVAARSRERQIIVMYGPVTILRSTYTTLLNSPLSLDPSSSLEDEVTSLQRPEGAFCDSDFAAGAQTLCNLGSTPSLIFFETFNSGQALSSIRVRDDGHEGNDAPDCAVAHDANGCIF